MSYNIIQFSNKGGGTTTGSNGVPFKQGDVISLGQFQKAGISGWNESLDGVYRVEAVTSKGLVVTGGSTAKWGDGSINQPFAVPPAALANMPNYARDSKPPYSVVRSSGGAAIENARGYNVGNYGAGTDWWVHAFISPDPGSPVPTAIQPAVGQSSIKQPVQGTDQFTQYEIEQPQVAPLPTANTLPTANPETIAKAKPTRNCRCNSKTNVSPPTKPRPDPFDIGKFVASANFVAGTSGAANVAGATAFREDARSAAKKANLNKAQTKKLLDTVEAAIAKSKAKAKNKVLAKLKKKK